MATDIRTSELKSPVDVAEYLFTRLHQIGVRSVHGVPGDYNLVALDYIPKAGLKWVGNVNELNAGKSFTTTTFFYGGICFVWISAY
jgi:pyruvate decarboxylase